MERQRGELVPISEVFSSLDGTVKLTDVVPNQRLGHSLSC